MPLRKVNQLFAAVLLLSLEFILACGPSLENNTSSTIASDDFVLAGMTIADLQLKMQQGKYTSRYITELYLTRIKQLDKKGPTLNAIIEINPEALELAIKMDLERDSNIVRGPLHGIPILLKDNIDTKDQLHTTAGSLAMMDNMPLKDAFVVERLRAAGAIILGKTNLTEWANFRSTKSISGWSSRGGQTKNPYILDMSPCGSSSGSAVAVAADLCMIALGTETDGSIACPASMNGVVGIKPTVGLISRTGIIPISKSLDSPGPIARTVKDAAILLGIVAGYDPEDLSTYRCRKNEIPDYTRYLKADGLKGKRIGIEKSSADVNSPIGLMFRHALEEMKKKGATIVEVEYANHYAELADEEFTMLAFEFKDGLNRYLGERPGPMKSIDDIIHFNVAYAAVMMPTFQHEKLELAQSMGSMESEEYLNARNTVLSMHTHLEHLMLEHKLDAFCGVGSNAYSPAAVAGYPSITIPMGLVNGAPIGITFFARPFDEPGLLSIGYSYEQASKKRTAPKFLPTRMDNL